MATQKLYAGAKLREMRQRLELTQKDFAAKLGVSLKRRIRWQYTEFNQDC